MTVGQGLMTCDSEVCLEKHKKYELSKLGYLEHKRPTKGVIML